jgi:hypothetical protein
MNNRAWAAAFVVVWCASLTVTWAQVAPGADRWEQYRDGLLGPCQTWSAETKRLRSCHSRWRAASRWMT